MPTYNVHVVFRGEAGSEQEAEAIVESLLADVPDDRFNFMEVEAQSE